MSTESPFTLFATDAAGSGAAVGPLLHLRAAGVSVVVDLTGGASRASCTGGATSATSTMMCWLR